MVVRTGLEPRTIDMNEKALFLNNLVINQRLNHSLPTAETSQATWRKLKTIFKFLLRKKKQRPGNSGLYLI